MVKERICSNWSCLTAKFETEKKLSLGPYLASPLNSSNTIVLCRGMRGHVCFPARDFVVL